MASLSHFDQHFSEFGSNIHREWKAFLHTLIYWSISESDSDIVKNQTRLKSDKSTQSSRHLTKRNWQTFNDDGTNGAFEAGYIPLKDPNYIPPSPSNLETEHQATYTSTQIHASSLVELSTPTSSIVNQDVF